jgi:sulfur carrier protein ThiS
VDAEIQLDPVPANTQQLAGQTVEAAAGVTFPASVADNSILSGITSLANWLRRLARKDGGTAGMIAAEAEINTGGTSTRTATTDNLEAIYDSAAATAALATGGSLEIVSRVSGGTITAYIGDDYKVRSGTEIEIPVADVGGALHTKLAGYGVGNLDFGASRDGKAAGEITGTIANLAYAANVLTITVEITACATGLRAGEYTYQIQSSQTQGADVDDYVELEGTMNVRARRVAAGG